MGQIHRISGNLLACTGILVHGCNCKGVMGSGVAAAIRNRWPDVYKAYREKFLHDGLRLGDAVVVASSADRQRWSLRTKVSAWSEQLASATMVVNLMTQEDYGRDPYRVYVDYDAISRGFEAVLAPLALDTGLPVYFPKIGCGLANGDWQEVSRRIEAAMPEGVPLFVVELA